MFAAMVFSSVGICVLVVGYLLLGAVAFTELELDNELQTSRFDVASIRRASVLRLWNITERFNTLHRANWTREVRSKAL